MIVDFTTGEVEDRHRDVASGRPIKGPQSARLAIATEAKRPWPSCSRSLKGHPRLRGQGVKSPLVCGGADGLTICQSRAPGLGAIRELITACECGSLLRREQPRLLTLFILGDRAIVGVSLVPPISS